MSVVRKSNRVPPQAWRTLKAGDQTFEVHVRQPKWGDKTRAHGLTILSGAYGEEGVEAFANLADHKIMATVTDWRGVVTESGEPIPFSFDGLTALCEDFPTLFHDLLDLANEAWKGLSEEHEKNLPPRSGDMAATHSETKTNDTSLPSIDTSSDSE